jgi:hypothetical protein
VANHVNLKPQVNVVKLTLPIDSIGLMVCCDQCEVWQHCECMGLEEHEIPDQYYCELCKPSDHVEVKGYDKYVLFIKLSFRSTY